VKSSTVLGIDIGATKVRVAPVPPKGEPGKAATFAVPAGAGPGQLADIIAEHAASLGKKHQFDAAGAGVPGHIANDRRTLLYAPNLNWRDVPFAELLESKLSLPVVLENDVNAAALGEHRFGAGRGAGHLICIFVGTGIGGGIICAGELVRGATGNAAEIGHMLFRPGGRVCNCGRRGCAEAYAGGFHISARYGELAGREGLNPGQILELARGGDENASRVIEDACQALVTLAVNLQTAFDAQKIVLGGGVMDNAKELFEKVREGVSTWLTGNWKSQVQIVASELGPDAGVLGAAALARGIL